MVRLTIDGVRVEAQEGEKLLWAALDAGIYIPHLCANREADDPFSGCRLCFVEIEGRDQPVTSCTETVAEGLVVSTDTPAVRRLQRTAAELLLASHDVDCAHCEVHRKCPLQEIAAFLHIGLKPKRLRNIPRPFPTESINSVLAYNSGRCVRCGLCVWVCNEKVGAGIIDFAFRGFRTVVASLETPEVMQSICPSCTQCVQVCPVAALKLNSD